jgi:AcrR family transcriptional regulator
MLSRAAVLDAALELVDTSGLAALNLRALATRLGVSAMTPYRYFADKAELLAAMVGHALAPLALEAATDDPAEQHWHGQLERAMRVLHDTLELHPGVVELIIAESHAAPLEQFRRELIAILTEVGLPRARAADALRTLTSYILGYTMLNRLRPGSRTDSFEDGLAMIMDSLRREVRPGHVPPD